MKKRIYAPLGSHACHLPVCTGYKTHARSHTDSYIEARYRRQTEVSCDHKGTIHAQTGASAHIQDTESRLAVRHKAHAHGKPVDNSTTSVEKLWKSVWINRQLSTHERSGVGHSG